MADYRALVRGCVTVAALPYLLLSGCTQMKDVNAEFTKPKVQKARTAGFDRMEATAAILWKDQALATASGDYGRAGNPGFISHDNFRLYYIGYLSWLLPADHQASDRDTFAVMDKQLTDAGCHPNTTLKGIDPNLVAAYDRNPNAIMQGSTAMYLQCGPEQTQVEVQVAPDPAVARSEFGFRAELSSQNFPETLSFEGHKWLWMLTSRDEYFTE